MDINGNKNYEVILGRGKAKERLVLTGSSMEDVVSQARELAGGRSVCVNDDQGTFVFMPY